MYSLERLSNGIPVISIPMQGVESVTTLVLAGAGSFYEEKSISGISHFLEHMFFKGGMRYKTPKQVSETIDAIGGEFNAFTGKEYAGYYVKCSSRYVSTAIDVLSDMLLHAQFPEEEIQKERKVIEEEMHMYQDMPLYQIYTDFESHVFGNQPLGWDIIGTKESLRSLGREDFIRYKHERYTPDNMVIILAGKIEKDMLSFVEEGFSSLSGSVHQVSHSFVSIPPSSRVSLQEKNTEQTHCIIGGYAPSMQSDQYIPLKVLSALMGGMMSSRLFQNIREDKGLCYSVHTGISGYLPKSLFYTKMGVDNTRINVALEAVRQEYLRAFSDDYTQEELTKSKNYLIGHMTLKMEETDNVASFYGEQLLLHKKIESFSDIVHKIERVTMDDLKALSYLFAPENQFVSIIGPQQKQLSSIETLFST